MEPVIQTALEAISEGDWDEVKLSLHPYLHWTDSEGETHRGRTQVMEWLRTNRTVSPPASFDLRDGQIYRWSSV